MGKKAGKGILAAVICIAAIGIMWNESHHIGGTADRKTKGTADEIQEEIIEFPKTYQKKVSDYFEINAKISVPEDFKAEEVCDGTAEIKKIEEEKWKKRFLKEDTIYTETNDGTDMKRDWKEVSEKGYENEEEVLYLAEQTAWYNMQEKNWSIPYVSLGPWEAMYSNEDKFSKTSNLSFMTREELQSILQQEFETLGIDGDYSIERFLSIDYKTLEQEEQNYLKMESVTPEEMKESWSEADDSYHLDLCQKFAGLPVYPYDFVEEGGMANSNFGIRIMYNKSGFSFFRVRGLLEFQKGEERLHLLPFEEIADTLIQKYGQIKTEYPLTVETGRLVEAAVPLEKGYQMRPIWIFEIKSDGNSARECIPIDAVTGEEVMEMEYEQ